MARPEPTRARRETREPADSDAIAALRRALLADARDVGSLRLLAQALVEAGKPREALARLDTLVKLGPLDPDAHRARGLVLRTLGRTREAIAALEEAVRLDPRDGDARVALGDLLLHADRLADAEVHYRAAIAAHPAWSTPRVNLAVLATLRGDPDAAIEGYRSVLAIDAGNVDAANGLGATLLARGDIDEAVVQLCEALGIAPGHRLVRVNLGRALRAAGELAEAVDLLRSVVRDAPHDAEAWDELAITLRDAGDVDAAVEAARTAVARDARRPRSLVHLGNVLAERNDLAEAEDAYRRALRLQPDLATARWNLALAELARGDFARGWRDYEARWSCEAFPSPRRAFDAPPATTLEGVRGRRVLVHAEQGLGDTIQFVRLVPLLADAGARVFLEVQPPLATLLRGFAGTVDVVPAGQPLPPFDLHVPLMSLPLLLRRPDPDGRTVPYIRAEAPSSPRTDDRRRIGIVWAGGGAFVDDRRRSLRFHDVTPLFDRDANAWHGLQKDVPAADRDAVDAMVSRHPHLLDATTSKDFAETAALIAGVDLVVGVDTAVVHLAGAMGKPVWVMLPFAADFRWLLDRDDSPWYPTARLFRQTERGRWDDVIERVGAALAACR